MQHRFVGDVGDFGKYGLLRALTGVWPLSEPRLTLGVVWYLPAGSIGSAADGQKLTYLSQPDQFRGCDPRLYDTLGKLDRSLGAVEASEIMGDGTIFFDGPVPQDSSSRGRWLQEAVEVVRGRDVVFLDPDNGFAPRSAGPSSTEHAYVHELKTLVQRGQTVVVYHHLGRTATHPVQMRHWAARLAHELRLEAEPHVLWYRRGTARAYFVIPADAHAGTISERLQRFGNSLWFKRRHFTPLPPAMWNNSPDTASLALADELTQSRPARRTGPLSAGRADSPAGASIATTTVEHWDSTVVRLSDFHPWIAERAEPLFADGRCSPTATIELPSWPRRSSWKPNGEHC